MRGKGTLTDLEIFDTPTHHALEQQLKEYYKHNAWCKKLKSKRSAQRARKALIKIKKLAHLRGLELLNLYTVDPKRQKHQGIPLYRKIMQEKEK